MTYWINSSNPLNYDSLSADFPTTPGSLNETYNDIDNEYSENYVYKLNPDGSSLEYSTLFGGTGDEYGLTISVDLNNNMYVTGRTSSLDFPTTSGVLNGTLNTSDGDFAYKISADGSSLIYSTYINEHIDASIDSEGNLYLLESKYNTTINPPYNDYDICVSKLNNDGSTYLLHIIWWNGL